MEIKIERKAIEELRKILEYPPYLIFVLVSMIFVSVSLVKENYFNQVWIFFLYSVIGSLWRYIEKDIDGGLERYIKNKKEKDNLDKDKLELEKNRKTSISHLGIIIIYHIGNIILFFALLYYIKNV